MIPALLFPFSGWPRAWVALATLRRPFDSGMRFALCWLVPVIVVFSFISGKQLYYPLPEFAGAALLIAGAIAALRDQRPALANNPWLGTWPLGVGGILFGIFLFVLPVLVSHNDLHGEWFDSTQRYSRFFSVVFVLLGILLLLRGRGEMRRLAFAGLVGTLALNTLFTLTMWQNFDLRPSALMLGSADAEQRPIGLLGNYEGQFHFAGRLTHPIERLYEGKSLQTFAQEHPDGRDRGASGKADQRRAALCLAGAAVPLGLGGDLAGQIAGRPARRPCAGRAGASDAGLSGRRVARAAPCNERGTDRQSACAVRRSAGWRVAAFLAGQCPADGGRCRRIDSPNSARPWPSTPAIPPRGSCWARHASPSMTKPAPPRRGGRASASPRRAATSRPRRK